MLFEFNRFSGLLLPFFIQGLLFFVLLLLRGIREEKLHDRLLAFLILIYTIRVASWMLGFAGWYDSHDAYSTFMFYFQFDHWFFVGPLVYFYFRSLTNSQFQFRKKDLWHFFPGTFMLVYNFGLFFADVIVKHGWQGQDFPLHFGTKGTLADGIPPFGDILFIISHLLIIYYFIRTAIEYRSYRQYIDQNFSKTDQISFSWLKYFLYAVAAGQVIWILFRILDLFTPEPLSYVNMWYSFFLWGIIIYYLSIYGFNIDQTAFYKLRFNPHQDKSSESEEENGTNQLAKELVQHLETQKPYLNPEISLPELARQMGYNTNQLSGVINKEMGKNFNELINQYRIETVKERLVDPAFAHLSILGIAFESGFNSKATFNRAFKHFTQQTPSEFLKKQKTK
jgi:AraC-like DNA-binding protein